MDMERLIQATKKPALFDAGTAVIWTDPYISRQLLKYRIDPDNVIASRSDRKGEALVAWLLSKTRKGRMRILDLGCGPSLYARKFAERGHQAIGVDFSKTSLEYATTRTLPSTWPHVEPAQGGDNAFSQDACR